MLPKHIDKPSVARTNKMLAVQAALAKKFVIFSWRHFTKKDAAKGALEDPFIEGIFGQMQVHLFNDGELTVFYSTTEFVGVVDMSKTPVQIAESVFDAVKEGYTQVFGGDN